MANYNIFSYLFSTPTKISIVGEGIINILLLDLKVATFRLKSSDSYVCPFGMKTAQHPIITLIHKKNVDILDVANKLNGICNHLDERWVWLIIYRTGNRLVHACLNNRYEWIPIFRMCLQCETKQHWVPPACVSARLLQPKSNHKCGINLAGIFQTATNQIVECTNITPRDVHLVQGRFSVRATRHGLWWFLYF